MGPPDGAYSSPGVSCGVLGCLTENPAAGEERKGAGPRLPNHQPAPPLLNRTSVEGRSAGDYAHGTPPRQDRVNAGGCPPVGYSPSCGLVTGADLLTWSGDRRGVGVSVPPPPYGTRRSIRLFL
jgi:hypothetical protein